MEDVSIEYLVLVVVVVVVVVGNGLHAGMGSFIPVDPRCARTIDVCISESSDIERD
jgi:uncharacterized protein (UPF0333 family)